MTPGRRRPLAALALACGLIIVAIAASAASIDEDTLSSQTLLLAACAAAANLAAVSVAPGVAVSGSFCFGLLAAAYVSPAAGFVVVFICELVTFVVLRARRRRYRFVPLLMNLGNAGTATVMMGLIWVHWVDGAAALDGEESFRLGAVAFITIGVNFAVAIVGSALYDRVPLGALFGPARASLPGLLGNAALFAGVGPVYAVSSTVGLLSAVILVLLITYVSRLAVDARAGERRIGELAADRADLLRDIVRVESLERRRLADQLHDGPLQSALAARDDVRAALSGRPERLDAAADALAGVASDLRSVASNLWDAEPRLRVTDAVREFAERQALDHGYDVDVRLEYDTTEHDALVFAIARELLLNVGKHARASSAGIELTGGRHRVLLQVRDNGRGMSGRDREGSRLRGHIGLASVETRVHAADGTFSLAPSSTGLGTVARVELPLSPASPVPAHEPALSDPRSHHATRTTAADATG